MGRICIILDTVVQNKGGKSSKHFLNIFRKTIQKYLLALWVTNTNIHITN